MDDNDKSLIRWIYGLWKDLSKKEESGEEVNYAEELIKVLDESEEKLQEINSQPKQTMET